MLRGVKSTIQIVAISLIMLIILSIGLVVLEAVFGNWFNAQRLNRLNLIRSATITYDASGNYAGGSDHIVYRRDAFGLRGTYPSPDRIDILTIGGSTTDQRLITEGETWQDVLGQEFARHGKAVSVVNAGVDGQSTFGHIRDFNWWFPLIPKLRVRYFLFYIGVNDFYTVRYKDEGRDFDDLEHPKSITDTIRDNSALYNLYRTILGIYQATIVNKLSDRSIDFTTVEWTDRGLIQDYDALMKPRLEAYRVRLRQLGQHVEKLGGKAICVTQSARKFKKAGERVLGNAATEDYDGTRINGVDYYHMLRRLNQATLEECTVFGGVPLDLGAEIDWEEGDFYDFYHNTPQGAARIGRYLYAKLSNRF